MHKIRTLISGPYGIYFLGALLLRLLLMPFFGHTDIFNTYRRAAGVAFGGTNLFALNEQFIHGIQAVWLLFLSLFTGRGYFMNLDQSVILQPQVNTLLFLFKVPYLIAEVAMWYFLFRYLIKPGRGMILFVLLNPVLIFTAYIFGRYDTIICLAIVVLLVLLKKTARVPAVAAVLSVLLLLRPSMLLILPALVFSKRSLWFRILSISIPIGIYGAVLLVNKLLGGKVSEWIATGTHTNYFYQMQFQLNSTQFIYIFFVLFAYFGFRMTQLHFAHHAKSGTNAFPDVVQVSFASFTILGIYYATSIFHPQYFSWIVPFAFVLMDRLADKRVYYLAFLALFCCYFGYQLVLSPTIFNLLFPVSSIFSQLMNYPFMYEYANIAKSFISGILLFLIISLFKHYEKNLE